jgi:phosphatidyl-myo-inositol alpha-mannosyltransferase
MAKVLKIGLVLDDSLDKPDGVQQYVLTIGHWLAGEGHEVHYLVGETKRSDLANLHSLSRNIKVRFNKNRMAMPLPARLPAIRELLRREEFDVLHVQVPYSPALAGRIIKAAGNQTAVVGMFHILPHSRLVTAANHVLSRAVRGSLKRFDTIVSNSAATAVFARKVFGATGPVVPLPLELSRFTGIKPFGKYQSGKTVLFLGRLVERKGCQYLLRAVAQAKREGAWPVDARVVICGDGPLRPSLEAFVKTHHLEKMVEFTGYISEEDKPRYLASADVVAYPSTGGESFGIVLLEAMAASPGVVLAGNNPGYASVMAPRPAALFDPQDSAALARKIIQAITDGPTRTAAHAWQQQYIKQFDVAVVGKRTVAIYKEALHKRRG